MPRVLAPVAPDNLPPTTRVLLRQAKYLCTIHDNEKPGASIILRDPMYRLRIARVAERIAQLLRIDARGFSTLAYDAYWDVYCLAEQAMLGNSELERKQNGEHCAADADRTEGPTPRSAHETLPPG